MKFLSGITHVLLWTANSCIQPITHFIPAFFQNPPRKTSGASNLAILVTKWRSLGSGDPSLNFRSTQTLLHATIRLGVLTKMPCMGALGRGPKNGSLQLWCQELQRWGEYSDRLYECRAAKWSACYYWQTFSELKLISENCSFNKLMCRG
jgi:hypothetical protein